MEDFIRESLQKTDQGIYLNLEPNMTQRLIESIRSQAEKIITQGYQAIILCSPLTRRHIRHIVERFMPQIIVLSHQELTQQIKIQSMGTVEINPKPGGK